jgi:hypothetical protein
MENSHITIHWCVSTMEMLENGVGSLPFDNFPLPVDLR